MKQLNHCLSLLILILLSACTSAPGPVNLVDQAPADAALLIRINNFGSLQNQLKNNDFTKALEGSALYERAARFLSPLNYLQPEGPALLAITEVGKANFEFTFITKEHPGLFRIDSTISREAEQIPYEGSTIKKLTIGQQELFFLTANEYVQVSSSKLLIENAIRNAKTPQTNPELQKLFQVAQKQSSVNLFLNHKYGQGLLDQMVRPFWSQLLTQGSTYTALDIDLDQSGIKANGVATLAPETNSLADAVAQPEASGSQAASIVPSGALFYLTRINPELQEKTADSLRGVIMEWTQIQLPSGSLSALYLSEDSPALQDLPVFQASSTDQYAGTSIFEIKNNKALIQIFGEKARGAKVNYGAVQDRYLLLSDNTAALYDAITAFQNQMVMESTTTFKSLESRLPNQTHLRFVAQLPLMNKDSLLLSEQAASGFDADLIQKHRLIGLQFQYDQGFAHINLASPEQNGKASTSAATVSTGVAQRFTTILDAPINGKPVFVKNHRSKGMEIVVQDTNHNLYLISEDGKVLWKKSLEGPVLGSVQQVDLYRNGRLQLAFVTQGQLHIIDRNGNTVAPFPLSLPKTATQELSIFDYDNSKNYRFVIAAGNEVLMYDRTGAVVDGFKFSIPKGKLTNSPKHIRIGNKDFICVSDDSGNLHLLHRTGAERLKAGIGTGVSQNPVFLYENKFTTTTGEGELIQIDGDGKISRQALALQKGHHIDATAKTLVTLSENTLSIKDQKITLDYGMYTTPEIFYLYDKIYVSVTDTQANKVYLFDSNGQLMPNFPVYGTSAADLHDLNNDRKPDLVVRGEKEAVITYSL